MGKKLHFQIHYVTIPGEQVFLKVCIPPDGEPVFYPLNYVREGFWEIELDYPTEFPFFQYAYVIRDGQNLMKRDEGLFLRTCYHRSNFSDFCHIRDFWMDKGHPENAFFTDAFSNTVLPTTEHFLPIVPKRSNYQITFHIRVPYPYQDARLLVLGNHENLGNWNPEFGLKLSNEKDKNEWIGTLSCEIFPQGLVYKYAWLLPNNQIIFESGENRYLGNFFSISSPSNIRLHDIRFNYPDPYWRGAGVAVPVFSLRSRQGLGVGEFNDLRLFADWASESGFKMIQILPINDTCSSQTWTDSYPYAAISVFALHPLYLHIESISGWEKSISFEEIAKIKKELNSYEVVDYEKVLTHKLTITNRIFEDQWELLTRQPDYKSFYDENKEWLEPYALFSFFRDKFQTVDFNLWGSYRIYNKKFLEDFLNREHEDFRKIAFFFFLQFHLDKQLSDASQYAKSKGVILKGDLPIGIFKHSTDAWITPDLFNMEGQAGAPPDPFSETGQNWGFPTYNWSEMARDGYKWWKNRMVLLAKYFGAYRIDHILGFFRIWEIPANQVDGLMGVFNPSIPLKLTDFEAWGISFDERRFCQPYLPFVLLKSLFGPDTKEVINTFFEELESSFFRFKSSLSCQKDLETFLSTSEGTQYLRHKHSLFQLICEVLFIRDKQIPHAYHPRIHLMDTRSFKDLNIELRDSIQKIHDYYFYQMQEEFWRQKALEKLPAIKESTNMLICGEDLGMVPACVSGVMRTLGILSLEIQRMSKNPMTEFLQEKDIPFLSVVSPSTHDMAPIRAWWEETDRAQIQRFYEYELGGSGEAPRSCTPDLVEKVFNLHLNWPSLWAVFPIQDILGMEPALLNPNPAMERINVPANPKNYWQYRVHLPLEQLLEKTDFSEKLRDKIRNFRALSVS
jgi:4-alpha-glucanotransferase